MVPESPEVPSGDFVSHHTLGCAGFVLFPRCAPGKFTSPRCSVLHASAMLAPARSAFTLYVRQLHVIVAVADPAQMRIRPTRIRRTQRCLAFRIPLSFVWLILSWSQLFVIQLSIIQSVNCQYTIQCQLSCSWTFSGQSIILDAQLEVMDTATTSSLTVRNRRIETGQIETSL